MYKNQQKERLIKINNDQINLLNADIKSNEIKSEELNLKMKMSGKIMHL